MRTGASPLSVDDGWVDQLTAVLGDDVADDADVAGFRINLDLGAVGSARPATLAPVVGDRHFQGRVDAMGQVAPLRGRGHVLQGDGAGGYAYHRDPSFDDFQVGGARL